MRHFLLPTLTVLALALPVARAQSPAWVGGVQTISPAPGDDGRATGNALSLDAGGNQYVGGALSIGASGPYCTRNFGSTTLSTRLPGGGAPLYSGFVAKLSTGQQWLWATKISNLNEGVTTSYVAATPGGEVYASGAVSDDSSPLTVGSITQTPARPHYLYVTRLNPSGQAQWVAMAPLAPFGSLTPRVQVEGLAWEASSGTVLVVGQYNGTLTLGTTTLPGGNGAFLARLSAAGQWLSAVRLVSSSPAGNVQIPSGAVAFGPQGQVAVGLRPTGTLTLGTTTIVVPGVGGAKIVVAQFDGTGQVQWATQVNGSSGTTANADDAVNALRYDAAGNLWAMGTGSEGLRLGATTLPFQANTFVGRLSRTGQWTAVGSITCTAARGSAYATALDVDAVGNALLCGELGNSNNLTNNSFGSITLTTGRNNFVARLGINGQWQYAQQVPGGRYPVITAIAVDALGSMVATGQLRGSVTFDVTTLNGAATGDAYVARLANAGAVLAVRQAAGVSPLALYPNPTATGTATLRLPATAPVARPYALRDALGRTVRTGLVPAGQQQATVPTAGLAPGLYLLEAGESRAQLVVE